MRSYSPSFDNITPHQYRGLTQGPHLLVLGGIHGNEICGQQALQSLCTQLNEGTLTLKHGTLTLVPQANPWACATGVRYVERNLNRVIDHNSTPKTYEEKLGTQVAKLIDECDFLLDVHSVSSYCPSPFVFNDFPNAANNAFCKAVGATYTITHWHNMFLEGVQHQFNSTQLYLNKVGKTGCLVECGQHVDPAALQMAVKAVSNILKHLGFIEGAVETVTQSKEIVAKKAFIKQKQGQMANPNAHNFMPVKQGEVIATYSDGQALTAPEDAVLLLPYHKAQVGDEWFYLGKAL